MNEIREQDIRAIVERILSLGLSQSPAAPAQWKTIPTEISARHVHLTQQSLEALFGSGAALHSKRALSQAGQFLAEERVRLVGPKGVIENVAVLGPVRPNIQVELSLSDARTLGVNAPIRQSGDLSGAGSIYLVGPCGILDAKGSVIASRAHVHMTPKDASRYGVQDGALVSLRLQTDRPLTLEQVVVRVSEKFSLAAHIDVDEANAAHFSGKEPCAISCTCASLPAIAPAQEPATTRTCSETPSPASSKKKILITELDAHKLISAGKAMPEGSNVIVTPLAKDAFLHAKAK